MSLAGPVLESGWVLESGLVLEPGRVLDYGIVLEFGVIWTGFGIWAITCIRYSFGSRGGFGIWDVVLEPGVVVFESSCFTSVLEFCFHC